MNKIVNFSNIRNALTVKVHSFKGSRQWESRRVWSVSICPNLARTAAIEVCFSLNFAVVFDFIYFVSAPVKQND